MRVMYCLLCHEKIPRLRAWRTKSQFCSDDCAAKYKNQTMERLLTAQSDGDDDIPLPIDEPAPEDLDFALDVSSPAEASAAASDISDFERDVFGDGGGPRAESAPFAERESESPFSESSDELWRLADEVGSMPRDVDRQTAEDALEALAEISRGAEQRRVEREPDEIELAAQAPPEPDFGSELELLDESELEIATQPPPEGVTAPQDGPSLDTASILDELVRDSDWNAQTQAQGAASQSEPDGELEQAIAEHLEPRAEQPLHAEPEEPVEPPAVEPPVEEPAVAAEAPVEAAAEANAEKESAAEAIDLEDLYPREEEFVESIQAAADRLIENSGPNVVAFPRAADAEEAEEPAAPGPDSVELDGSEGVPAAKAPDSQREAGNRKKPARRAPRLRPAAVMAGLFPTPSGGDEEPVTSWEAAVGRRSAEVLPLAQRLGAEAPMLNGLAAAPIAPEGRYPLYRGLSLHMSASFVPATSLEGDGWTFARPEPEPLSPTALLVCPAGAASPACGSRLQREPAGRPILAEPSAQFSNHGVPPIAPPPAMPMAPAEFLFESVSDGPAENAADDDGDWFTDIEGFESL